MLRLRPFDLLQPASLDEALEVLAKRGPAARVLAGGTDLLPTLKLGLGHPEALVSLRAVRELSGIGLDGGFLKIGSGTRLHALAEDLLVRERLPALAEAAGRVASPQIRHLGTLGGNVCLDTRCRYVNQSELFREALGGCLKSHGTVCHVVPGGRHCVAALSSDTVPVLVAYGARVEIAGPPGRRDVAVIDLYGPDGTRHVLLQKSEVLVSVRVPLPLPGTRVAYRKWAPRRSIDFPLVSIAVRLDCAGDKLAGGTVVVGVLGPRPRVVALEDLAGASLDEALATRAGELVFAKAKPLPNVPYDPEYRHERLAVEARRAVRSLLGLPERRVP